MKITLSAWAAALYSPAPSIITLRRWVKQKRISPEPVKVGRTLMVEETAVYVPGAGKSTEPHGTLSARAQAILRHGT